MRGTWGLGLGVLALAIAGTVDGQQSKSALSGLNTPASISTKTVNNQAALKPPNTTKALQSPLRTRSTSFFGLPKLSLTTWPPKFAGSSVLPRANNPFQPTAPKGANPFDTARPVAPAKTVAR